MHHVSALLVSLVAVLSHRAIFLPNNLLLTYEPHSFPIVLSAHVNDQ